MGNAAGRPPAVRRRQDLVGFAPDDQGRHRDLGEPVEEDRLLSLRADQDARQEQLIPENPGVDAEPEFG